MPEDASLDDFLDAGDREVEPGEPDDEPSSEGDSVVESADDDQGDTTDPAEVTSAGEAAVEPAGATYDWTPGGAACEACGVVVERRWRDEDALVCEDCKNW